MAFSLFSFRSGGKEVSICERDAKRQQLGEFIMALSKHMIISMKSPVRSESCIHFQIDLKIKTSHMNAAERWTESTMADLDNRLHCWPCKPVQVLSIKYVLLSIRKQHYDIGFCTCPDIYGCSSSHAFRQVDVTESNLGVKYGKRGEGCLSTKGI